MGESCNLCGSDKMSYLYTVGRFKEPFDIYRCDGCGLVFQCPLPSASRIERMYSKEYYAGTADYSFGDERKDEAGNRILYNRRLEVIEGCTKGRILDIGCAFGLFLKVAKERGWEVHGVELSKHSAEHAKKLGLDVFNGTLEDAGYPAGHFDAVVMIELIEHLPDPKGTLKEVNRVLKGGGYVMIQTANVDSITARLDGKRWHYFLPGHLHYFSRKTLRRMLEETGFEVVKPFIGDELGLGTKVKAYLANTKKPSLKKLFKLITIQTVRQIGIGDMTMGGMIFYARKVNDA